MAKPVNPPSKMQIGPDQTGLRGGRPYFLVPLRHPIDQKELKDVRQRILNMAKAQKAQHTPITDLYVLSHGWHRNFFTGVAAYDRLVSRLTALLHRRRLTPPKPFNPLFLMIHWHSDPGSDNWVDPDGRRDKNSFMTNVRAAFRPGTDPNTKEQTTEALFANDFENIYELFSSVSAPDTDVMAPKYAQGFMAGWQRMAAYRFRDSDDALPEASLSEKAAMVWRCYDEAEPRGLLLDQADRPKPYNNLFEALSTLIKFLLSTLGVAAVVGFLVRIGKYLPGFWQWLISQPPITPVWGHIVKPFLTDWVQPLVDKFMEQPLGHKTVIVLSLCLLILLFTAGRRRAKNWQAKKRGHQREGRQARGVPVVTIAAWAPLQLILGLPMLLWALTGYLLGGLVSLPYTLRGQRSPLVFNERYGKKDPKWNMRDLWAAIARFPLFLFKEALPRDSRVRALADGLDNQFAFWEMQRKGVNAGRQTGEFLAELLAQPSFQPEEVSSQALRVHLVGHSFGGLVVANAARYLAEVKAAGDLSSVALQTVCLVQGALASDWFVSETELLNHVQGAITCIYSGYDTANGFYYPLSNNGRMAAGYVGLYRLGADITPLTLGEGGLFASLVVPPNLSVEIKAVVCPPKIVWQHALNLDASRVIYHGPPAAGGGHGDIFKDDVIHLIWAVTTI